MSTDLQRQFGDIDIYLFDQLLRGRIGPGMRIFDAGFGGGRNLVYFVHNGYEVFGVDNSPDSLRGLPPELRGNFRIEPVEASSFPNAFADVVISSAVLHFAQHHDHFRAMLQGSWRVLRPGGLFFCRLASTIGMETQVHALHHGRYLLPDGSERYLVNANVLEQMTEELGGTLLDPLKTTVVHQQRAMTTWVLQKNKGPGRR